jgi:protocatechuate 3,4-dioxygenase beta subunit
MKVSTRNKKIVSSLAAATLLLGTSMASSFAAQTATTNYNIRSVSVGNYSASVNGLVAMDKGHYTEFLPIYYVIEGLTKMGYQATWNGTEKMFSITAPAGANVSNMQLASTSPTSSQLTIALNGMAVQVAPRVVAKDPLSGAMTTFVPIWYINQVLTMAGLSETYNGKAWTVTTTSSTSSTSTTTSATHSLSALSLSNENAGTGTQSDPAISQNSAAISLSTTLTDANGNPVPNTAVTFNFTNYGNSLNGSNLPTVENASGTMVAGTNGTNAEQYSVFTNASGVASISITGPNTTFAYQVVATAPYVNASGQSISTAPAYLEYTNGNNVGISPYAASAPGFDATLGGQVPVLVVLPKNTNGNAYVNSLITLTVNGNANFTSSNGSIMGKTIQVATNSAGIAQAYVSDQTAESVEVTASNLPSGLSQSTISTYLNFGQAGIASKTGNFSVSSTAPNIGSNVTVSGQLQDPMGNPVANGQVLVVAENNNTGNTFGYINGSTTTTFPVLGSNYTGLAVGTPATSAYGDLVTADANGNFSFELTDSRADTQNFAIYPVNDGQIGGAAMTAGNDGIPTGDETLAFANSTNLAYLSIGNFDSIVQSDNNTTLTGDTAQTNAGNVTLSQLAPGQAPTVSANEDNGSNSMISDVFVEPQNSAGYHGGALNQAGTYNLSASNGGEIYSLNGVPIPPSSAVNLTYTPVSGAQGGYFTVNGSGQVISAFPSGGGISTVGTVSNGTWSATGGSMGTVQGDSITQGTLSTNVGTLNSVTNPYQPEDFEVGVIGQNTGTTVLTVNSGNVTSTDSINFTGGTAVKVGLVTPAEASVSNGQNQTVTLQVQDTNGNPVPNVMVPIALDNASSTAQNPFWITSVNGTLLTESVNMATSSSNTSYTNENTPIPVGVSSLGNTVNYSVNVPGIASWQNTVNTNGTISPSTQFYAYSDAAGQISLTLTAGGATYPTIYNSNSVTASVYAQQSNAMPQLTGTGTLYLYTQNTSGQPVLNLQFGGTQPQGVQGTINWIG